jgi:hypothetical protein
VYIQGSSYLCLPVQAFLCHGDRCIAGREADTNFADESLALRSITLEWKEICNVVDGLTALYFMACSSVNA